ncbi:MAG TPA: twin-arginine translocation signal domain-containing protein, partial [Verrucomicrobiae bacterium]|nr:twin-arginine translocation signal domain-containing protein [Verrucomicrobiae bacterium]
MKRRSFLKWAGGAGALAGLGDLGFVGRLPSVSAAEAKIPAHAVRLHPEIEPLVRLLEETPRDRVLEEIAQRIRKGLTYREVIAA